MTSVDHYDKKYFDWQQSIGKFGGIANRIKFEDLIKKNQKVLDFGCGGGYLLDSFENIEKFGVEINEEARKIAIKNKIKTYESSFDLPSNFFDLIISNNALEHVDNPIIELKELYRSLKIGGKISLVVPCDNITYKFKKNDINFHLYSYSPMNLGNILTAAGFEVISSTPFIHKWPPFYNTFKKFLSWKSFHFLCKIYGRLDNRWWQTKAVAKK
jgi:SAM-dependent methyltransferase